MYLGLTSKKDLPGLGGNWSVLQATNGTPGNTGTITLSYVLPNNLTTAPTSGYLSLIVPGAIVAFNGPLSNLAYYGTHSTESNFSNSRGAKHAVRLRTLA